MNNPVAAGLDAPFSSIYTMALESWCIDFCSDILQVSPKLRISKLGAMTEEASERFGIYRRKSASSMERNSADELELSDLERPLSVSPS